MEQQWMKELEQAGNEIWDLTRDELLLQFPYLDTAFRILKPMMSAETLSVGTDGIRLFYNPAFVFRIYGQGRSGIHNFYLHMLLHCLFLHQIFGEGKEKPLWDLSCDIAVEYFLDRLVLPEPAKDSRDLRNEWYGYFESKMKAINGEGIYSLLKGRDLDHPEGFEELFKEFCRDDHGCWSLNTVQTGHACTDCQGEGQDGIGENGSIGNKGEFSDRQKQTELIKQVWHNILKQVPQKGKEKRRRAGTSSGALVEYVDIKEKRAYDYRRFLKKFAVNREEMQMDDTSFDYILYTYGLNYYGNMPLIEHLEYKEMNKLEEFVIAIDTSGSCSKKTVELFLAETYAIFCEKENFFKKMNVHIIQCDSVVQTDRKITCEDEWKAYMKDIVICGRAGTDFRPVFSYVDRLIEKKEIRDLKGLLYFTDGDGIYPVVKPSYETAFVFLTEPMENLRIPSWAITLILPMDA